MNRFKSLVVFIILFMSNITMAADPNIYSHPTKGAVGGADVVAYFSLSPGDAPVMGSKAFSYEYQGATWYFSSQENLELFSKNPEKYAPQYGGYCAFAASHGFTKSIDINYWHIVDGKLYLNFNKNADRKWLNDRDAAIVRANSNWPNILKACEQYNNCGTY